MSDDRSASLVKRAVGLSAIFLGAVGALLLFAPEEVGVSALYVAQALFFSHLIYGSRMWSFGLLGRRRDRSDAN